MKRTDERRRRISLTLLFGGVVLLIILAVLLVIGIPIVVLSRTGIMTVFFDSMLDVYAVLILIAVSLLIGAGITYFLGRLMMKPMNRIISAMGQVASGNYKVRLDLGDGILGRNTSIREFTQSFNVMAEELDHTEILRSDFVNNFSHEFKTPIVSIAGFAKLLRRGNLTETQKEEYAAIIEEESMRLSAMATAMLSLTRIENQTILTDVTAFNLSEQIRGSVLLLEEKWSKKRLDLDMDFDEVQILANEELLKQVWINLLDNAVKFADVGGTLGVSIRQADGWISVAVSNTGSTISAQDQARIFNKFYQADTSHSGEGSGIGLAIVKKIVDLHKGSIGISCPDGRTVFTVALPERQDPERQ